MVSLDSSQSEEESQVFGVPLAPPTLERLTLYLTSSSMSASDDSGLSKVDWMVG